MRIASRLIGYFDKEDELGDPADANALLGHSVDNTRGVNREPEPNVQIAVRRDCVRQRS
jgi:hypothetical protein